MMLMDLALCALAGDSAVSIWVVVVVIVVVMKCKKLCCALLMPTQGGATESAA